MIHSASPTTRFRRPAALVAVATVAAVLVLPACSSTEAEQATPAAQDGSTAAATPSPGAEAAAAALATGATVIDVRTPEEYDAGHVDGAELIDIRGSDFAERVASLDPAVTYVVYCRSGNRSAAAAEQMESLGLTVLDGGALEDMSGAGWATA